MKQLFENFQSKAESKAREYIRQNCADEFKNYLDTKVADLPAEYKKHFKEMSESLYDSCVDNDVNLLNFFRLYLESRFDIRHGKGPIKYIPGIARIACQELKMFEFGSNDTEISSFKNDVMFLFDNPELVSIQYDKDLNGLSYEEFHKEISPVRKEFNAKKKNLPTKAKGNSNYTIVPINTFEEAHEYGGYTSWCVTQTKSHFDNYTSDGRRFYFCLEHGFEMVDDVPGEGCPLDEYGLSMISVLVDMEGEPSYITTRWNHKYDGENNENFHTVEQFERITGIPFYETFRPYTKEELRERGIVMFDEVQDLLDKGKHPHDVFDCVYKPTDSISLVVLHNKLNYLNRFTNKLLSEQWFANAQSFDNGYARVTRSKDMKKNIIDSKGNIMFKEWYDGIGDYHAINNRYTAISDLIDGQGMVNIIDDNDNKILKQWVSKIYPYEYGFFAVSKYDKNLNRDFYNIIDEKGNIISDMWFDYVSAPLYDEGIFIVEHPNEIKYNVMDNKGNLLSDTWFDDVPTVKKDESGKIQIIKESLEEKIDTTSFHPKEQLNQKLWDEEGNINPYARRQLLAIAKDFINELDIDNFEFEDIIMTGSLANYNWDEENSDIDLHILVDFSTIGDDKDMVKKMFDAIKSNWNSKHNELTIFSYPVEIYVQDTEEEHRSSGVYSLLYGKWIKEPDADYMNVDIDYELIEDIAGNYEEEIDNLADELSIAETDEDFERTYEISLKLYDEIKGYRKKGMEEDKPEMSTGNLIFKALRRNGSIEKLLDIRNQAYDKMLSI